VLYMEKKKPQQEPWPGSTQWLQVKQGYLERQLSASVALQSWHMEEIWTMPATGNFIFCTTPISHSLTMN
jgi:hypothetical protein